MKGLIYSKLQIFGLEGILMPAKIYLKASGPFGHGNMMRTV